MEAVASVVSVLQAAKPKAIAAVTTKATARLNMTKPLLRMTLK
jgi:hypothetical protein